MVRYLLSDVTDDMILGQSIFTPNGDLLLAAGYQVTALYRKRLAEIGIETIFIEVEGTESVRAETVISDHVQREMSISFSKSVTELTNVFSYKKMTRKTVKDSVKANKNELERLVMNSGIANALEKFIDEILNQSAVVLNLSAIDKHGSSFFQHSINVTIISLCLGRKFRLSYEEMKQLGMGALNYDLGLVAVPKEILESPGPLSHDDAVTLAQHTVFGHLMLSANPAIPPTSSAVALQHHECQDGSGYPRGIKGENRPPLKDFSRKNVIHRFSEIVAVADAYDMLTIGRLHYSERRSVKDSLRAIIMQSGKTLNSEVVKMLTTIVPLYPVGTRIRVINAPVPQLFGFCGVVAKENTVNLDEPQIILYESKSHQKIKPVLIDMSLHKGFVLELLP